MRVCYFIQAHNNPEQVYRLVKTIKRGSPNAIVVIGYDCTNSSISMEPLQNLSDIYLLTSNFPIRRGEFSILRPYLNAINWLLDKEIQFDWLAYLSGQDYPIQPLEKIEKYLAESQYDGFLQHYNVLSYESHWSIEGGKARYFLQYFVALPIPKNQLQKRLFYRFVHLLEILKKVLFKLKLSFLFPVSLLFTCGETLRIGTPVFKHFFNQNFICYGGNHRHFLSRKCLVYLRKFIANHPRLIEYYERTELPEESFIQTVLVNSDQFNFYNHHQIYDNYKEGSVNGHPKILTIEDYSKIIESNCFFARKFEPNSPVLDKLDNLIFTHINS